MMVPKFEGYSLDNDGLLIFDKRIYIQPNDELRSFILRKSHREMYMALLGVMKMKRNLNPLFLWKGKKAYIVGYMVICLECQQVKVEH
jgi:hypothetical protein